MTSTAPSRPPIEHRVHRWPPSPHHPSDRVRVRRAGRGGIWEVRIFSPASPLYERLARRGMLHLQLWHPGSGVSVLSPSALTGYRFEAFPIEGWTAGCFGFERVHEAVRLHHGLELPARDEVESLETAFVAWPECCARALDERPTL